ncbi:MAG: tetratricopeptide repeat protein [Planctomycetes bacterium]|nr:tetratricopeptide repeat protein [Planctomycetota bacterium]
MKLLLAAVLALGVGANQDSSPADGAPASAVTRWSVKVEREDGEAFVTVRADQDPLLDVLREIAAQAELSIDGADASWRRTLVSADLRRRPLRQVLAFLLGSVGLRGEVRQGALHLRESMELAESVDSLREAAMASYLRVLRDFPEHPLADDAVHSQALIEEQRERYAAARANYESLIERYPSSELVPQSMFKSGTLLMREGAWQDAAQRLSDLLRLEREHEFEPRARLELAFCVAELGNFERALYMVDALESIEEAVDVDDERRRAHVRIKALAGLGQGREALALLDEVDRRLGFATTKRESLALRASASESAGLRDEAARAWLSYGRLADGAERAKAYSRAARLALDSGDELAALFVAQLAKREGLELPELTREARQRLALDEADLASATTVQRLARAERLYSSGLRGEALKALQAIEPLTPALSPEDQLRFQRVYAQTLAAELDVDAAISFLRTALPTVQDPQARKELYLLAADLLEQAGRVADAIEAYRGKI